MFDKLIKIFKKKEFAIVDSTTLKIDNARISSAALSVIKILKRSGWDAYIVGGAVRDILLGVKPKDFDIVTNARPNQVKLIFRRARIIGRRFRIVHVYVGGEIIEVSTFRAQNFQDEADSNGRILRDNVYGTIEDDVRRRDLTINSLYYDPISETILDYHRGVSHLRNKEIRVIGKIKKRFSEDPIRIVRIIRLAAKLDLRIPKGLKRVISNSGNLLKSVPKARLSDDFVKLVVSGESLKAFNYILELGLDNHIFPNLGLRLLQKKKDVRFLENNGFLYSALKDLDERIKNKETVSLSFIFAVLFWEQVNEKKNFYMKTIDSEYMSMQKAIHDVLSDINKDFYFQRKHITGVRELCLLQARFNRFTGKSPYSLVKHNRFSSAFKLFELRVKLKEVKIESVHWWEKFYASSDGEKKFMVTAMRKKTGQQRPYRKKKKTKDIAIRSNKSNEKQ